mgnify:CR=1 FL=1
MDGEIKQEARPVSHTPGPWFSTPTSNAGIFHISTSPDAHGNIATAWGVIGNAENDARLIAAAADMLAALLGLLAAESDELNDDGAAIWQQARAALTKATGTPGVDRTGDTASDPLS